MKNPKCSECKGTGKIMARELATGKLVDDPEYNTPCSCTKEKLSEIIGKRAMELAKTGEYMDEQGPYIHAMLEFLDKQAEKE